MSTHHDEESSTHDPITLANVDQYLDDDGLFLPHHENEDGTIAGAGHDIHGETTGGPTSLEIDAAIKNASKSLLEQQHEHDSSSLGPDPSASNDPVIDPSLEQEDDVKSHNAAASSSAIPADNSQPRGNPRYPRRMLSEDAVRNPTSNLAPFIKPQRTDDSPHPEQILFHTRPDFETWLKGESSWCHYVQRRITNPDKRAEERLKARIRAHERAVAGEFVVLCAPCTFRGFILWFPV